MNHVESTKKHRLGVVQLKYECAFDIKVTIWPLTNFYKIFVALVLPGNDIQVICTKLWKHVLLAVPDVQETNREPSWWLLRWVNMYIYGFISVSFPWNKVHGANMGPLGLVWPRWAPWWPHKHCYQGCIQTRRTDSIVLNEYNHFPPFLNNYVTAEIMCDPPVAINSTVNYLEWFSSYLVNDISVSVRQLYTHSILL